MHSGIYKIVNTINNKIYIGSTKDFTTRFAKHFKDLRDGKHCNIHLQRSYNKHGESAFTMEIIEYVSYEKPLIMEREQYWIDTLQSKKNGYNIANASFGDVLTYHPNRDDIISRIKATLNTNISNMSEEERKSKWGKTGETNGMFGKTHSDEVRTKLSQVNKGNTYRLGKPLTNEDTCKKLSDIAKLRVGEKNGFYGKTHSPETLAKISASNKGKVPPNRLKYSVNGVVYDGLYNAEEATGISYSTIRHRCLSKNPIYSDYFVVMPPSASELMDDGDNLKA